MKTIRIAAIQMCSTEDRKRNLSTARMLMEKAIGQGARLISLPENFSFIGLEEGDKIQAAEDLDTGPGVRLLRKFAEENEVAIIGGSIPLKVKGRDKVTNTCLVVDTNGDIRARYDKIHLFDVTLNERNTFSESSHVEPGENLAIAQLFGVSMGITICYDLGFPEIYRALALRGAKVFFVPSAFTLHTGKDHWEVLLRARSIENQCFTVAAAQFGRHNRNRISY